MLDIPAWFILAGRFAGTGSSRRPESRDASACSTVIASGRCRRARPALADGAFTPGHVAPMTQDSGTSELMTQLHDAWFRLDETGHAPHGSLWLEQLAELLVPTFVPTGLDHPAEHAPELEPRYGIEP